MPQTGASEISAVKATPISPGGVKCVCEGVWCVTCVECDKSTASLTCGRGEWGESIDHMLVQ